MRFNTERELCAEALWHQGGVRIDYCSTDDKGVKELQKWELNGIGLLKNIATEKCIHAVRRYVILKNIPNLNV